MPDPPLYGGLPGKGRDLNRRLAWMNLRVPRGGIIRGMDCHDERNGLKNFNLAARVALALVCAALPLPALSQDEKPKITEETPYVPSPKIVVDTMLRMAGVRAGDFLIDLGSGDGRIIITAALEMKARGFGVDYDARLVKLANNNARKAGVSDRANFIEKNIFDTDLGKASVVTMYLLPEYNLVLKPTLLALKPGTRIVSHDYGIGDWEPDAQEKVDAPEKTVGVEKASWIYSWVVPAQVAGHWRSRITTTKGTMELELDFKQRYQRVEGTAKLRGGSIALENAVLKGDALSFQLADAGQVLRFQGRISAGRLSGQYVSGNTKHPWRAQRVN